MAFDNTKWPPFCSRILNSFDSTLKQKCPLGLIHAPFVRCIHRSHRWIFLTRACNTGFVVLPAVSLKKLLNTQSRCRCLGVIWYDWSIVTKSCRPPVNSLIGEYLITANKAQQNHVQLFVKCYQVRNIRYCMIPLNHQPQYQEYNSGYLNGYRKVFFMATRVCICGQVPYSISYETCWWAWNMVNSYYTFSITIKECMTWLLGGLVTQLNTFYMTYHVYFKS